MVTHGLYAVCIAAALVAASTQALADDSASSTNTGAQQPNTTQVERSKTSSQGTKKQKQALTSQSSQKKGKQTAQDASKPAPQSTDESVAGKVDTTVQKIDTDADKAAASMNEDVVGKKTQRSNAERARDPKLRPRDDREAHKAAEAVGKTTTTAADFVATRVEDSTRTTDPPGPYAPLAIEVNPLGLIVGGRYSAQIEYAPVTHHVILVSPHIIHTSADIAVTPDVQQSQTFTGFGGEIGYRYYTGHRGMNGVFIGPSFLAGAYNASLLGADQAFTDVGVAVDVGVKGIVANHLALGGGVGLEYLHVSHDFGDLPTGQAAIASSGVKPRLIFEAGYAF